MKLGEHSFLLVLILFFFFWGRTEMEYYFYWGWGSDEEWFWPFHPFTFTLLKTTFCKYWILIRMKISMTCVYIMNMKFVWGDYIKTVILRGGMEIWWGIFSGWGGWANFWLPGEDSIRKTLAKVELMRVNKLFHLC